MGIPRNLGLVALLVGLVLLVVGSVVLAVVPDWGQWLRDYPQQAQAQPIPEQARPVAQVMLGFVLGPLLEQVGGWIRSVGYFVGTVIVLLSLFPLGSGLAILAGRRRGEASLADEAKDTRARLVETAIRALARFGLRGATTRRIAADAGVAELTLFRHFRSKQELLATAIAEFRPPIRVPEPTDDVAADLRALLTAYVTLTDEQQELILGLFAELLRHPELLPERPPPGMSSVMGEVVQLFRHHQATGRLWREEPPEELALAFVGPLMARFLLRSVLGVVFPLDPEAYVRGFLAGRGADRGQGER